MRRLLILAVGLGAALAVPVAQADEPVITPAPSSDFVDTTSCGFPVSIHFTVNGETAKTFSSGKTIVTGPFVAQFSANGKSVTLNVAGRSRSFPSTVRSSSSATALAPARSRHPRVSPLATSPALSRSTRQQES